MSTVVVELTPDQARRLDVLRATLPDIVSACDAAIGVLDRFGSTDEDELVCIDCEWDEKTGELDMVGIGNARIVVQLYWNEVCATDDLSRHEIRYGVEQLVRRMPVVYHNAVADIKKLRQHGFKIHPKDHRQLDDTMLAHAALHSEEEHTLEYLVEQYGKLPQHKDLRKLAPREYNAADVVETVLIWKHALLPELRRDPAAESIYREMSLAYLAELQIEQEEVGIRVDKSQPYPLRDKYAAKIVQAARLAYAYAGWPINLKSPDDMQHRLYTVERFPIQRKKAPRGVTGEITTAKDAIAVLRRLRGTEWDPDDEPTLEDAWANVEAGGHPLLEARYLMMGAQQALSHYVMPCFETDAKGAIVGVRDRIYPEVRIHVQETGRHSYVHPALSQYKGALLNLITPDVGHCWVGHDWSNIETWLLGYLANDPAILEAKRGNWDTHTLNYCDITGTPYPPVLTKALHVVEEARAWRESIKWQGEDDTRRIFAKRFVYRLHYRGKAEHAGDIPGAKALGFDAGRLVRASELYLARHPALVAYWRRIEEQADRYGVVYTFLGRPRRLTSEYRAARAREACNDPMQAGVADIYITTALLVKRAAPWARLVFGSYDSQWWQVPTERKEEFRALYEPIVTRTFHVNGQDANFPASFKEREAA